MLPNFLIIGAARSGTTFLYNYLNQHPNIYMSPIKEPYFFSFMGKQPSFAGPYDKDTNKEIITNLNDYKKLFYGIKDERAVGECSNSYLFFPETAKNIKHYIPNCKITIIIRNPIERTYSHYLQSVMLGHEHLSLEGALDNEKKRLSLNWRWHYQYTAQSMYFEQVKRYFNVFGQQNVGLYFFDDLVIKPSFLMRTICQFLNVDPSYYKDDFEFQVVNSSGMPKSQIIHRFLRYPNFFKTMTKSFTSSVFRGKVYSLLNGLNYNKDRNPEMLSSTREYLTKLFKDDVLKLQNFIGRDLSKWLSFPS